MRKSRLSKRIQARLLEHFVSGTTARCAAELVGVNRKTAAYYFLRLREIIGYQLDNESHEVFAGEIELDESYFGGSRKGKRGRRASGKVPVFGILKRGGRVYTKKRSASEEQLSTDTFHLRKFNSLEHLYFSRGLPQETLLNIAF